jgi:hypothetical protein
MRLAAIMLAAATVASSVVVAIAPAGATTNPQLRLYTKVLTTSDLPAGAFQEDQMPQRIIGKCSQSFTTPLTDPMVWTSFLGQERPAVISEELATSKNPRSLYRLVVAQYSGCRTSTFTLNGSPVSETAHSINFPTVGNDSRAFTFVDANGGIVTQQKMVVFRSGAYVAAVTISDPSPTNVELKNLARKALSRLAET